jgi:hypothetical protein
MKYRIRLPLIFLAASIWGILFFAISPSRQVYACSTPTPNPLQTLEPTPTIQELAETVELVLDGTVSEILIDGGYIAQVKIAVERYYKGDGPEEITATLTGWNCQLHINVGARKIFYGRHNSPADFDLFLPATSGATEATNSQTIAELTTAPPSAALCTPPIGGLPRYTVAERVAAADIVLEGTVTAVSGDPPNSATITVLQYIKGSGPATVTMGNFGPGSICRSEVNIGDHRLFYASGDPAANLQAFYLSQFDAVASAEPQIISEAIAAAGQEPFVPVEPEQNADIPTPVVTTAPAGAPPSGARSWVLPAVLGVSCLIGLLGMISAVLWRSRSRG